jgi:GntR family transcriptional regulator of arabinose operon
MNEGDRLSSERQLSEYFKVDRVTIRRAMLDLSKEGFIVKHRGKGTFIAKKKVVEGKPAAGRKTIAIVIPDVEIVSHAQILKGLEREAAKQECKILIQSARLDADFERQLLADLISEDVDGVITIPIFGNVFDAAYQETICKLISSGKKVVLMEQYVAGLDVSVVMVDKVKMGYMATEHLIMLGHRKIAFFSTHTFDTAGNDAFRGYCQALEYYGVDFNEKLVFDYPVQECAKPAYAASCALLKENPKACSAIATPQFSMTYGIYKTLKELGLERQIELVGTDAAQNPLLAHITHIAQPTYEMGEAGLRLMLGIDSETNPLKRHILLSPKLVMGSKVGMSPKPY